MTRGRGMLASLALVMLALLLSAPAAAVEVDEVLADQALESRARAISAELRCLVCQNQSIDDSHAPLARDLRIIVRERLVAGDTNAEIFDFVVDRYGEFVLLRPRFTWHTLLLWGAAPLFLLMAGVMLWRRSRGQSDPAPAPLSSDEERRLAEILSRDA